MLPPRFSLFGGSDSSSRKPNPNRKLSPPMLNLRTEKEVYRPGDEVVITIEISTSNADGNSSISSNSGLGNGSILSFLIKRLSFEIKGIEKLDSQWFATQKPPPESKRRRGEYVFMDCSVASVASNQIVSPGADKTYVVRTVLPGIIPPSYRGATIRYLYYVKTMLLGQWQVLEIGRSGKPLVKDFVEQEARVPLQIWVDQKNNGLALEDGQGIIPSTTIQLDIYWKEMGGESDWIRANDIYDGFEEGYDSSKDEVSSVSSYNPNRESLQRTFGSSLSLQSSTARSSTRDLLYPEGERASLSSNVALPQVSAAEVINDTGSEPSPQKLASPVSSGHQQKPERSLSLNSDEPAVSPISEGYVRGRSYNIRMDDQVLLRFSPKNSDSTYYFSDMIGGTLTFFHGEGARRCLEISITLETSEIIDRRSVHPSRRHSPTITKIQSDHHEVVADLVQTSFLFSIPMDGPMSFSTPHVSVQWSLRFEFYTTPKNVDWTRYDHPLLIEGRDRSEWVLPIAVHAPPPGAQSAHSRSEKPFSLEPLWGHN